MALEALGRWQIPPSVLGLLGAQWRMQQRWLTDGGAIAEGPLTHVRALPQGCPWAPVAMSAIMAAAAASKRAIFTSVALILYLDDRTLRASTAAKLKQGLQAWMRFEDLTGMQENAKKRQIWGSTPAAAAEVQREWPAAATKLGAVLGVTLNRKTSIGAQSAAAKKREEKAAKMAIRAAMVPSPQAVRKTLAASGLTTISVWPDGLSGRGVGCKDGVVHWAQFAAVVGGRWGVSSRASRDLTQVFAWGPASDLPTTVAQNQAPPGMC